jgi:hypothetical protein
MTPGRGPDAPATAEELPRPAITGPVTSFGTWVDGVGDRLDPPALMARDLGIRVAAGWSAVTGLVLRPLAVTMTGDQAVVVLEETWEAGTRPWPVEAVLGHRLDRTFGRHAGRMTAMLADPVRGLLGRRLVGASARARGQGRVVVELALGGQGQGSARDRRRSAGTASAVI